MDPPRGQLPLLHHACRQSLADFAKAIGGRVDTARTGVPGFGRSAAGKASWAGKKKESPLHETLHMTPQPVTMKSIGNVKVFTCETLDEAGQRQLQNAHKRLLVTASKQPTGVEVGRVFDLHMKPLSQDVVGTAGGHSVRLPNPDVPYVAIHTHPACGNFSNGDLYQFTQNTNLKLLTAIGHDDHIYAVEETSAFQASAAKPTRRQMDEAIDKLLTSTLTDEQVLEKAEGVISDCIKELQNYGIKFYG